MSTWEVHAIKYAERNTRTRADSFLFDDDHGTQHPMDYFMWLLQRGDQTILVDTGYDEAEAKERGRPILKNPHEALRPFGVSPDQISDVIVTHLHYDHAGGLHLFPNAQLHLQAAEMEFATGPCMCHPLARFAFSGNHVCEAVQRLYAGKLTFYDGDGQIAEGVTVHRTGGHSRGMQAVRVLTSAGYLVLASDASHYYENFAAHMPFPLVVDVQDALDAFVKLEALASAPKLIVPGHDPLVTQVFPATLDDHIWRLDRGPVGDIPGLS